MYLSNVGGSTYDGRRITRDPQPTTTSTRTQTYLEDLANQRTANQANSVQQTREQFQGTPSTQTTQPTNPYTLPYTPSNTDQYWKHDLWENIQNEKRKPKWSEMGDIEGYGAGTGRLTANQETMDRLGLKTQWYDEAESGPMGEGSTVEKYAAGNYLDPESAQKYQEERMRNNAARPNSKYFGADWRPISEHDKYKVLDPRYVIWDDTLGWITHKKNYNPDGDKSWWQKNVSSFLPAAMGTLLGGPAGTAIGLGMGAVKAISGQTDWRSLLPMLLTAGFSLSGANEFLGKLAPYVRNVANYGLNQVTRPRN